MIDKYGALKKYFGYDSFRNGQEELIDAVISGRDCLGIMPTGAGKSICYQIPALVSDGVTLVVSPLISLMKDQVGSLVQNGVRAAYLNSSLTPRQYMKALDNMADGVYKIVYVAPERLSSPEFYSVCSWLNISLIAVDEAHCVSHWGQDFRPSYLKIADFVSSLRRRPTVCAFTATATDEVGDDIIRLLALRDPFVITTGFDRPNLRFISEAPSDKKARLLELVRERHDSSGIVYCATRKNVEEVADYLTSKGYPAAMYHAGLPDDERARNQDEFVYDKKRIIVATNAFGMGIDKSNVSFVIHYNMPKNLESYYQEAGRAGRDGGNADCILLYSPGDVRTNRFLIENSEPNENLTEDESAAVRRKDLERLKYMTFYSTTKNCLRHYILSYFGESSGAYCGNCSNCLSNFKETDITADAKAILSCVSETGERYGKKMIIDILRGSRAERIISLGLDAQLTYGIMKSVTEKRIRELIDCVLDAGYLVTNASEYPILQLTAKSASLMRDSSVLTAKLREEEKAEKKPVVSDTGAEAGLLDALKKLRREIASAQNVPAYVVFSDATITDMCRIRPRTSDEFLSVSGVGKTKLERYGKEFLAKIAEYADKNK